MKYPEVGDVYNLPDCLVMFTAVDYKKKQALVKFFRTEEEVEAFLAAEMGEMH